MGQGKGVKVISQEKPIPEVTDGQVEEILHPEFSSDIFKIEDKTFSIRVLPYKWEMQFRKYALPLLQAEYKPIEQAIFNFRTERHLTDKDLHITESIMDAQAIADEQILKAVATICVSQDDGVKAKAAAGEELTAAELLLLEKRYSIMIENAEIPGSAREYLRGIITVQMDKQQMVQNLGEDLLARLEQFVGLAGAQPGSIRSLRQLFMQQVRNALEQAGQAASTWAKSSLPDMDNSSVISSQSYKTALVRMKDNAERELERLAEEETRQKQKQQEPTPNEDEQPEKKTQEASPLVQ